MTAKKDTTAQRIRDYLREHGPQTTQQIMAAFGLKWANAWGACRPQVATGMLTFDEATKAYSYGREPREPLTDEQRKANKRASDAKRSLTRYRGMTPEQREAHRAKQREYDRARRAAQNALKPAKPVPTEGAARRAQKERERNALRAAQRKAERGSLFRLVQNKEARKVDNATRQAERADSAQAMRNREHGVRAVMPNTPLPCSSAFIAANPHLHQVLRNGDVSPASRFQRLEVRA